MICEVVLGVSSVDPSIVRSLRRESIRNCSCVNDYLLGAVVEETTVYEKPCVCPDWCIGYPARTEELL